MKKTVSLLFALLVLFSGSLIEAKEEAISPGLATPRLSTAQGNSDIPFSFLVSPGKWSQAESGPIFTSGMHRADFTLPSLKETPAPIPYPRWAVREGWQGNFVVAIEVLTNGKVGRWKIMESTGYSLLDEVALKTIQGWNFHPATEKGKTVVSCIQIPVHFALKL